MTFDVSGYSGGSVPDSHRLPLAVSRHPARGSFDNRHISRQRPAFNCGPSATDLPILSELDARDPDRATERIATFHGGIGEERREAIKAAFNADPDKHPLRILIATDAAREGVNLQNNCYDLFHFDVPWNPGRLEQRNGCIDRKLQPAPEVNCHYFVLPQRAEDRVLDVLVQKTRRIHETRGREAKVDNWQREDVAWRALAPSLGVLPDNVKSIWHYCFTGMFNNAVDHSGGSLVNVHSQHPEVELVPMHTSPAVAALISRARSGLEFPNDLRGIHRRFGRIRANRARVSAYALIASRRS